MLRLCANRASGEHQLRFLRCIAHSERASATVEDSIVFEVELSKVTRNVGKAVWNISTSLDCSDDLLRNQQRSWYTSDLDVLGIKIFFTFFLFIYLVIYFYYFIYFIFG